MLRLCGLTDADHHGGVLTEEAAGPADPCGNPSASPPERQPNPICDSREASRHPLQGRASRGEMRHRTMQAQWLHENIFRRTCGINNTSLIAARSKRLPPNPHVHIVVVAATAERHRIGLRSKQHRDQEMPI